MEKTTEKGNEWIGIDPLTLWGKDGRLSVSFRNGYPRFTWFHRTEKGEKAKFFSAPMSQAMFLCLASIIGRVAKSTTDVKISLECSNKDFNTKEKFIQAVVVIAKRGDKVFFGMKNGSHDVKASYAEFSLGEYGKVFKDDSVEDTGSVEAALAYAEYMYYVLRTNVGSLAMNNSVPNTVRNENDRKNNEEKINKEIPSEETKEKPEEQKYVDVDTDIGF